MFKSKVDGIGYNYTRCVSSLFYLGYLMTQDLVFTVAAVFSAIGVIFGGVLAIYRISKRIDSAIGLDSQGRTLAERLERVEHQLWENGGSSLADRVNTIEKHTVKTAAEVELIKNLLLANTASSSPVVELPSKRRRKSVS